MDSVQIKVGVIVAAGAVAAFLEPVLPVGSLCTVMVVADVVSALRLRGRMKRAGKSPGARFVSRRLGRAVRTLVLIYVALCVAHGADIALGSALAFITGGPAALTMLGAVIFIWQLSSVLENESACNGSPLAAKVREYLKSKAGKISR